MKKLLSVVLAVAMVMAMGVVSLAAAPKLAAVDTVAYEYVNRAFEAAAPVYGDTVYYFLSDTTGLADEYDTVAGLKIKENWELGEDLVDSVKVAKKFEPVSGEYVYAIAVKLAASTSMDSADVVGEVKLTKKSDKVELVLPVEFEVAPKATAYAEYDEATIVAAAGYEFKPGTNYIVKFAYDDEAEFNFGDKDGGTNEGTFTVDVSGQGKLMLSFNTTANEAVVAANPNADVKFVNFNGAKFNRTGEMFFDGGDTYKYLYEVKDNAVVAIPTAEYDEYDEGFYFNTRVLGSYVLSDVELVNAAEAVVANPSTGAAA